MRFSACLAFHPAFSTFVFNMSRSSVVCSMTKWSDSAESITEVTDSAMELLHSRLFQIESPLPPGGSSCAWAHLKEEEEERSLIVDLKRHTQLWGTHAGGRAPHPALNTSPPRRREVVAQSSGASLNWSCLRACLARSRCRAITSSSFVGTAPPRSDGELVSPSPIRVTARALAQ